MCWNTGFSLVTDLNKGYFLPTVLKLNVWQGVCRVVRLDTNILIMTSVWGLEGAKNSTQKPHLTLFFIPHNLLLKRLRLRLRQYLKILTLLT